ncbi:MAG TPA: M20/M25/M40 family metallo-hydrolase [Verrucomicrobiae bacterium]|nr:M20/M25/M40 family metallo-hydrolase [Verrucomicrobiae bacterium]
MDVFELTRALIDIESITNNEEAVGNYLYDYLLPLAARHGGSVERMEVEPRRFNVFAQWGQALTVTLSTHLDTVPPFVTSREDDENIWGRGACDTKGIIAAMIKAVETLLAAGQRNLGLLFVVGEERNSAGAYKAAGTPRGSRYIVNGEPTGNRLALGSKGALRYELVAAGKMAHSAYPELGESAIHKLLDALDAIRRIPLPTDALLGPSTLNIGTLSGGRAPNVIADEAKADIMIRLVGDSTRIKAELARAAAGLAELREVIEIPAVHLGAVDGIPTTVVAFTTDIPAFGGAWGEPFLIGPGSIHVAHTLEERVPKAQLLEAVELYQRIVRDLCKRESK